MFAFFAVLKEMFDKFATVAFKSCWKFVLFKFYFFFFVFSIYILSIDNECFY